MTIHNYFEAATSFQLPPEQALAFFAAKGLRQTFAWQDMLGEEHDTAFTVAKMMDTDLLATVKHQLDLAMSQGKTLAEFRTELIPALQVAGWWGRQDVIDPTTGAVVTAQLGSAHRLETIFRTNLQSAYATGQWEGIAATEDDAPYLMYDAVDDHRTRASHAQWDGLVLRADDPWWDVYAPSNGWNCRCGVIQLDADQLAAHGLRLGTAPPITTRDWTNPRTGKVIEVPDGVDPGWDHNPGKMRAVKLWAVAWEKAQAHKGALAKAKLAEAQIALDAQLAQYHAKLAAHKAAQPALSSKVKAAATKLAAGEVEHHVDNKTAYLAQAIKALQGTKAGANLPPAQLLAQAQAKALQLEQSAHLSGYKAASIKGKAPSAKQQAAFDALPEEAKASMQADVAAKQAAAAEAAQAAAVKQDALGTLATIAAGEHDHYPAAMKTALAAQEAQHGPFADHPDPVAMLAAVKAEGQHQGQANEAIIDALLSDDDDLIAAIHAQLADPALQPADVLAKATAQAAATKAAKAAAEAAAKAEAAQAHTDAKDQLTLIATGQAATQAGLKKKLFEKWSKDGTAAGYGQDIPALVKAIEDTAAAQQAKASQASVLSGYKQKILAGKIPTPAQKAAFDALTPAEQAAFLAKVQAAQQAGPAPDPAPSAGVITPEQLLASDPNLTALHDTIGKGAVDGFPQAQVDAFKALPTEHQALLGAWLSDDYIGGNPPSEAAWKALGLAPDGTLLGTPAFGGLKKALAKAAQDAPPPPPADLPTLIAAAQQVIDQQIPDHASQLGVAIGKLTEPGTGALDQPQIDAYHQLTTAQQAIIDAYVEATAPPILSHKLAGLKAAQATDLDDDLDGPDPLQQAEAAAKLQQNPDIAALAGWLTGTSKAKGSNIAQMTAYKALPDDDKLVLMDWVATVGNAATKDKMSVINDAAGFDPDAYVAAKQAAAFAPKTKNPYGLDLTTATTIDVATAITPDKAQAKYLSAMMYNLKTADLTEVAPTPLEKAAYQALPGAAKKVVAQWLRQNGMDTAAFQHWQALIDPDPAATAAKEQLMLIATGQASDLPALKKKILEQWSQSGKAATYGQNHAALVQAINDTAIKTSSLDGNLPPPTAAAPTPAPAPAVDLDALQIAVDDLTASLTPGKAVHLALAIKKLTDPTTGHLTDKQADVYASLTPAQKAVVDAHINAVAPPGLADKHAMYSVTPTPASAATATAPQPAPPTPNAKPAPPPPGEITAPKLADLTQIGGQGGSNAGGLYRDVTTGTQWYVKELKSEAIAKNEVLTGKLYLAAGVETAETVFGKEGGTPRIFSKIIDGLVVDKDRLTAGPVPGAQDNFVVDAWLGNWDVVGYDYDNLKLLSGRAVRIDTGAGLLYRAQGEPKGGNWNDLVGEIDSLRNASTNVQSASVFKHTTEADLLAGARKVLAVPRATIEDLVTRYGPGTAKDKKALIKTLLARQAALAKRFPDAVPPPTPAPLPAGAIITPQLHQDLVDARVNGVAVVWDKGDIEDHNVRLTYYKHNRRPATRVNLHLTKEAAARLGRALEPRVKGAGSDINLLSLDDLTEKIRKAIAGINAVADTNDHYRDIDVDRLDEIVPRLSAALAELRRISASEPLAKAQADAARAYLEPWHALLDATRKTIVVGQPAKKIGTEWFQPDRVPRAITKPAGNAVRDWDLHTDVSYRTGVLDRSHLNIAADAGGSQRTPGSQSARVTHITASGERVEFWPPVGNTVTMAGKLQIEVDGQGEDAAQRVQAIMRELGIDTDPPTDADREELWLDQHAYLLTANVKRRKRRADWKGITDADQATRVARKTAMLSEMVGWDITTSPYYGTAQRYKRQAFGHGRVVSYRVDIRPDEAAELAKTHRLYQNPLGTSPDGVYKTGTWDKLRPIFGGGGMLTSLADRLRRGLPQNQTSPDADFNSGGGNYVFLRLQQSRGPSHTGVFFKPQNLIRRLDAVSYGSDLYGEISDGVQRHYRAGTMEEIIKNGQGDVNEFILKDGVSLLEDMDMIVLYTMAERNQAIADMKAMGYATWPDGRELTEVFRYVGQKPGSP